MFQDRKESQHIMHELAEELVAEAHKSGYELFGTAGVGPDTIFSQTPIRTVADIAKLKMWTRDLDQNSEVVKRQMGWNVVPLPVESAAKALDDNKVNALYAVPVAALVYQWFTRTKYIFDFPFGYLQGCFLVSNRAFDALPTEHQESLRSAVPARSRASRAWVSAWTRNSWAF